MHMGKNKPGKTFSLGDENIPKAKEEKDLGICITDDCKPSTQCRKAAAKAMSSLRIIKRTFQHIDKESFAILYKAYIRPHMEYGVQAWNPYQIGDIKTLEKIQKRATKLVPSLRVDTSLTQ